MISMSPVGSAGFFGYRAGYLHHIFASQMIGLLAELCVVSVVENNLGQAVAVTEVDESHSSHLARPLYPSGEGDFFAGIGKS